MTIKIYAIHISLIQFDYYFEILRDILSVHRKAIESGDQYIKKAEETGDEEYIDAVIDEQSDLAENIVGCAFVACQTFITGVVSRVKRLHEATSRENITLITTSGSRTEIMRNGSEEMRQTQVCTVEAIDALANYYKHNNEWDIDWRNPSGKAITTIKILKQLGLKPGSSGNLRTGLELLGDNLTGLSDILRSWQMSIKYGYEAELKEKGLL